MKCKYCTEELQRWRIFLYIFLRKEALLICNKCHKSSLPCIEYDYPNITLKNIEKLKEIEVDKIIGGSIGRRWEFWLDWIPKKIDTRYLNLKETIVIRSQKNGKFNINLLEQFLSTPRNLGPIDVIEIKNLNNTPKYYVNNDGHHRISIAKKLGAKKLKVFANEALVRENKL